MARKDRPRTLNAYAKDNSQRSDDAIGIGDRHPHSYGTEVDADENRLAHIHLISDKSLSWKVAPWKQFVVCTRCRATCHAEGSTVDAFD